MKWDCSNTFKRLKLSRTLDDMTLIEWEMADSFESEVAPTFTLQWSLSGLPTSDDWKDIPPTGLDTCWAADNTPLWSYDQGPHYRVVMYANDQIYRSLPIRWGTQFDVKRDWLYYREIQRRVCKDFLKGDGREGLLIKRRNWGERCPKCLDYDTGEVTDSKCPVCYGTGIQYGYFDPVPFWTKPDPYERETQNQEGRGMVEPNDRIALALGSPYIEATDVWVDLHADRRYFIHPVGVVEAVRDQDVVVRLGMNLAEPSNIVYMVPLLPREISSSSSSEGS